MPYLITTGTPWGENLGARDKYAVTSRRAVATLDDARTYMRPILERSYPHGPVGNAAALRDLEGFSPILLDDDTIVTVEWVECALAALDLS